MAAITLRRFQTLPNISFSYSGGGHARTHMAPLVSKYAATEVGSDEDEEMTSVSDEDDDMTESLEHEERSTPNTSIPEPTLESDKRQLVREEQLVLEEPQHEEVAEGEDDALLNKEFSEWEGEGGLRAVEAAFEGTFLLESSLEVISEWFAPIVWKLYLRQALMCSASATHNHTLPQDTPTPHFLPKLLTRAMPRYKGEMTRAIAVTHALLYLYRIKTCFHCTGSAASQQKLGQVNVSTSNPGCANIDTNPHSSNTPLNYTVSINQGKGAVVSEAENQLRALIIETAQQCSLFFAVGMHYASLWLLDCCPSEKAYWKRYVHCVPTPRGVAWSRLVLQHWHYRINVSVEDWLTFCSQLLAKFPLIDDHAREAAISA